MSIAKFFNQTITIYNKSSYNAYGREVVGTGTDIKARVQKQTSRKLLDNGNVVIIDGIVYLPAGTSVNTDDRIDYDGHKYKVYGRYEAVHGSGNTHHIKLEIIKWRQT